MTQSSDSPTPRREFLGQMAASAIVLAGAACASPASVAQTVATPTPTPSQPGSSQTKWDDSWTTRLTSAHKAVFDSPEIADNSTLGVLQARRFVSGVSAALGTTAQTVIVLRHQSIPFAFNDAMWEKYNIGEASKVKSGDAWAKKNVLLAQLGRLSSEGHILLGCDLATQGYAQGYAEKAKKTMKEVYEELKANLIPGLLLQPNGVYAVLRAQEVGCAYMRST